MKKRLIAASAIMALFSISLCGCSKSDPAAPPFEPAEPARSVLIADDESSSASSAESSQGLGESAAQSVPEYPVQNAPSYVVTITNYENGEFLGTETNTYDEHDSLIKSSSNYGDYFYAYEYNDDGTVRVKYSDRFREEYEYENGLEVKCTKYDEDGEVFTVTTHEYDEHGNATRFTHTLGEYLSVYTYEYEYDENGNWTKETAYKKDGEVDGTSTRAYDENGNVISGTLEETNALLTYEYKYDENGNEIEHHQKRTRDGEVTWERRVLTEYDEQGRISRKEEYRLDGGERLVSTEEYDYAV